MSNLIPLVEHAIQDRRQPGVTARTLYAFLRLNPAAYARWCKKNIVKNPYASEREDWENFQPDVENRLETHATGRPTQDFVLSLDFAKRLAMMARSEKGEEARQYFLACERAAQGQASTVPKVRDPAIQMLIDMAVQLDEARAIANEAKQVAAVACTKADLALEDAHRMTLEEFVLKNGLVRQFPPTQYPQYAHWLTTFCRSYGLAIQKAPVYGKSWNDENAYPLAALAAWLRHETTRPRQVHLVPVPS